ncbi:MAG TPA: DnaD domain protein [Dehalococcoidia bacterium]|nr:DnaD domain protein [Dehalococcoidia bacterium]
MEQFQGFPAKMQFTPLPNLFFSRLLPQISDIAELKLTLHIFKALYQKKGYPRFITYGELLGNASLSSSLAQAANPPSEVLHTALEMATQRGTIIHIVLDRDGVPEDVYFLNSESERQVVAKIQNGELILKGLKAEGQIDIETEELPDIFTLYEQNIGMLTPMIAEELREAEKLYPETWIRDAIKGAVNQNKRKWSYISAILERWSAEGRSDGTYQRDSKKDPDKYIKGKYGHMVRR